MDWISVKKRLPMIGQVVCIAYDGLTNKTTGEEQRPAGSLIPAYNAE
jgi:hypothetical protein